MKSYAYLPGSVRLVEYRKIILEFLRGDESAMQEIEQAVGEYLAEAPAADAAVEKDAQVRADLEQLTKAVTTLRDFFLTHGSARASFMGHAADHDVLRGAMALESVMRGITGERVVQAAEAAHDKWEVRRGSKKSPATALRRQMLRRIAAAAERTGITPKRSPEFIYLVQGIFDSAGIEIDADNALNEAGF